MSQDNKQGDQERSRLFNLLGEDVAKTLLSDGPTKAVMETALKEMQDEQIKSLVEKGKDKLKAVITAQKEITTIKKEFDNKLKAAEKKLGKLLGPLTALMTGRPQPPDPDDKEGEEEQAA